MKPAMKPLGEWICDECGEPIRSAADGWLEWIHEPVAGGGYVTRGVRIVHHAPASPRQPKADCYGHDGHPHEASMHLHAYTPQENGPSGLLSLLEALVGDPRSTATSINAQELAEVVRRIHVPHYEEARRYFARVDPDRVPSVDRLLEVIAEYDPNE